MMKKSQHRYLEGFGVLVILLALVRCAFPGVTGYNDGTIAGKAGETTDSTSVAMNVGSASGAVEAGAKAAASSTISWEGKPHRIFSVPSFHAAFPDSNAVQLVAAQKWGVSPVKDRQDAEARKRELVYIGQSPYYHVARLNQSIPYLVPHAALLLHDIGQAFYDSLHIKGIPLHQLVVSSVLRTEADVVKLRRINGNATEQSCHLYGTTFDISYKSFNTVEDPDGPSRRQVSDDTLKWVLSEVLRDKREAGRCYVKYEKRQSCFHMTVR